MGFFGLIMFFAPAIGPTLSGYIVQHFSWRTLFELILPFSVLILILAIFKLKNITPNVNIKIDVFSLILSSIAFSSLLFGFSTAGEKGWSAPIVYSTIAIGTIVLIVFIIRQLRLKEPMLEFRIFKYPMFALSASIMVLVSASMFSGMIIIPIYVQVVREFTPIQSGLLMMPGAIVMALMSPITGRLFDRYGGRALAIIGLSITVITTCLLSKLTLTSGFFHIMSIFTLRMLGMSLVMMPVMTNGLNQLPMKMNPHGTAMNNTIQQISGAIGSAVIITIMNARMAKRTGELMQEGQDLATEQLSRLAMLNGINFSFFVSTIIAAFGLGLAFFIKRVDPNEAKWNEERLKT